MEPLFEMPPTRYRSARSAALTRRVRDAFLIDIGFHPLSRVLRAGVPLHPDRNLTCGGCVHLRRYCERQEGGRVAPWKCWADDGRRVSGGDATTVRRSWPACSSFQGVSNGPGPVTGADAL